METRCGTVSRIEQDTAIIAVDTRVQENASGAGCSCCGDSGREEFSVPASQSLGVGVHVQVELHTPSFVMRLVCFGVLPLSGLVFGGLAADAIREAGGSVGGLLFGAILGGVAGFAPAIVIEYFRPNLLWPWIRVLETGSA